VIARFSEILKSPSTILGKLGKSILRAALSVPNHYPAVYSVYLTSSYFNPKNSNNNLEVYPFPGTAQYDNLMVYGCLTG